VIVADGAAGYKPLATLEKHRVPAHGPVSWKLVVMMPVV
jgi:hypothetical protein